MNDVFERYRELDEILEATNRRHDVILKFGAEAPADISIGEVFDVRLTGRMEEGENILGAIELAIEWDHERMEIVGRVGSKWVMIDVLADEGTTNALWNPGHLPNNGHCCFMGAAAPPWGQSHGGKVVDAVSSLTLCTIRFRALTAGPARIAIVGEYKNHGDTPAAMDRQPYGAIPFTTTKIVSGIGMSGRLSHKPFETSIPIGSSDGLTFEKAVAKLDAAMAIVLGMSELPELLDHGMAQAVIDDLKEVREWVQANR